MSNIRWMIRRDIPEVLDINTLNDEGNALSEEEFLSLLRERNVICMVVEDQDKIVGFMVYELCPIYLSLLLLQVHPAHKGEGIGAKMFDKLTTKISPTSRRKFIATQIRESNLDSLLWAKKRGFLAKSINKSAYSSPEDDGIFMIYDGSEEKGAKVVDFGGIEIEL